MLLERLIRNLAVTIEPFALCEVGRGCKLELANAEQVTVHFVLTGSGSLRASGQTVGFGPGTLIMVPHDVPQLLAADDQPLDGERDETLAEGSQHSGALPDLHRLRALGQADQADVVVVCGRINARFNDGPALFGHLTDPLALDFSDSEEMTYLFGQVLRESGDRQPGSTEMLAVLMNRCLVMAFRRLCSDDECPLPWLNALEDERFGRALDRILGDPGADHSVETLAEVAGMSRTSFAEGFKAAFGYPPMAFVRDVRLRTAADLLHDTKLGAGAIARRVGFSSRTHFINAFRRHSGMTPGQYRKGGDPKP